jgi:hypothetical protein
MDIITTAIAHFTSLQEHDKTLINHYTFEMDVDDWIESPLDISYEIINFVLKQYTTPLSDLKYVPKLMSIMTVNDIHIQIKNAQRLQHILDTFPKGVNNCCVFKGFMFNDVYFQKILETFDNRHNTKSKFNLESIKYNKNICDKAIIILPYFISTSVQLNIALRFTDKHGMKCICRIKISKDTPVPFIRDTYSNGTEEEVLLNIGGKYHISTINYDTSSNVCMVEMELLGYDRKVYLKTFWNEVYRIANTNIQDLENKCETFV